uniref:SUEL-type lectin domain-containing protein n=1 Tax=Anas platyrhynchos TaxID=8839 RepID=A0A8B9TVH8_ANAPL
MVAMVVVALVLLCLPAGMEASPGAWRVPTQGAEEPHHPHVRRGAAPHPLPSQDHHQHPGRLLRAPRAQPQPLPQPGRCVPGEHRVHVPHGPPDNHRVKTVCENNVLRLQCRPKSVLAIYSAHYGRFLRGKPECDAPNAGGPHIECLAPDALRRVSKKCHRKGNCTVAADWATFGDPCLPGTKKQLRVSYTCVPKQLLEEAGPDTSDPFVLSDYMHDVPEKVGLYFLCGVSAGLALLLCILSPKAAFLREAREALQGPGSSSEPSRTKLRDEQDEDLPDDSSSDSSFRRLTRTYRATDSIFGPELTAGHGGGGRAAGLWRGGDLDAQGIQPLRHPEDQIGHQGIKAKARGSGNEAASPGSCQPRPRGTPARRLVPTSPKGTARGSRRGGASEHLRCVTTDFQPPLATAVPPLQLTVKREEKLNAETQPCLCAAQLPASRCCFWHWATRSNELGLGKGNLLAWEGGKAIHVGPTNTSLPSLLLSRLVSSREAIPEQTSCIAPHRGSLSPNPSPIPRSRRTHEPPDGGSTAGTGRAGCATPSPGRHRPVPARAARPHTAAGAPSGGFLAGDRTPPPGPLLRQVSSSGGTRPRFPGGGCGAALEGFRRINRVMWGFRGINWELGLPHDKLGSGIST